MKRFVQLTLASLIAVLGLSLSPVLVAPTNAINVFDGACGTGGSGGSEGSDEGSGEEAPAGELGGSANADGSGGNSSSLCGAAIQDEAPDIVKNVINVILIILGMVAVIMIIIGGIRYTTSNGDSSQIKSAKDTILYAVVGLVVAIFAFAIVNFILERLS